MSRIIEIKKKPAAPWYIAGAVWVVGALALPIYELWALGLVAVASVAALAAAFKLCPPVIVTKEVPWFTGREDADEMLNRIDADRKRLLELDERIPDDALSAAIRRMEAACSGILAQLEKDPDKASQVRRFTNHYLPDAVKILTLYAEMEETGVSGENAEEVRRQVEANAAVIATAFENQLDSLYSAAALDLDADLEVLKGMLKGQGLVE
ncbi:MAG TPA: 5-bromo-4-chloroindolyl phosphate hydrolysis family protein [Candidatus Fournierella merdipullorum]|mgnify:FL=1|uniref:5-bromo-4-chloroindolyl phosphate hydrolysis family protein n=1 Tax=Candidatus Allofournierella merdipullorum TaxID=2838595 RepID=A0A9D2E5P9_9FIRM|nr:5-bromo-4-chloroindolyl phosphate hydrolysis family protein [Candidatus Fournierella merdipullorum]HIZ31293.1 5-bromo-4-chloroindolyl phosphate hydrolysis family protein [Candidatus Fournierella merdipullorum]